MSGLSRCTKCGAYLIDEEAPLHICNSNLSNVDCEHWVDCTKYGVNLLIVRSTDGRLYRFRLATTNYSKQLSNGFLQENKSNDKFTEPYRIMLIEEVDKSLDGEVLRSSSVWVSGGAMVCRSPSDIRR